MKRVSTAAALIVTVVTAPAFAQDPKFRVYAGGAYFPSSATSDQTVTYAEFQEQTTVNAAYSRKKGAGFDGSLEYDFTPTLGVAVGFHAASRENEVTLDASVPHPFFFNRPRTGSGAADLGFSEKAFHLDLVYNASTSGSLGFSIFGGPSFFTVDADVVERVTYTSAFPFDEITVTGADPLAVSKSAVGFNVGAGMDFRFNPNFGIGVRARFSQATISEGGVDLKAGGLSVGGGLSLRF